MTKRSQSLRIVCADIIVFLTNVLAIEYTIFEKDKNLIRIKIFIYWILAFEPALVSLRAN